MYSTGLELQQKLDKIIDYDQCSEEAANAMGLQEYCQDLFQGTFTFWGENELKDKCQGVNLKQGEDKCAAMNEHIFKSYKET